jgi:hypothetical protein
MTANASDDVIPLVAQAVETWKRVNSPEAVTKMVHKSLNEARMHVLCSLLGFEKSSWNGNWQIDHCNGRSGESIIGDYLREKQEDAIKDWIDSLGAFDALSKKDQAALRQNVREEYLKSCRAAIKDMVRGKANRDMQALVEEVTKPLQLDNYTRLRELIEKSPTA